MDIDFQEEAGTSLMDQPPKLEESPTGISPNGELHAKALNIIERFRLKRKIEKSGDPEIDWRYKLDYATCFVTPWTEVGTEGKKMLVRVVEELVPGLSSIIEPQGYSIRRKIVRQANHDEEETLFFIENEKTEDGSGRKANADQIDAARKLLSAIRKSLEVSPQPTNSNPNEQIRMKHFYRPEGARQLPVSP